MESLTAITVDDPKALNIDQSRHVRGLGKRSLILSSGTIEICPTKYFERSGDIRL